MLITRGLPFILQISTLSAHLARNTGASRIGQKLERLFNQHTWMNLMSSEVDKPLLMRSQNFLKVLIAHCDINDLILRTIHPIRHSVTFRWLSVWSSVCWKKRRNHLSHPAIDLSLCPIDINLCSVVHRRRKFVTRLPASPWSPYGTRCLQSNRSKQRLVLLIRSGSRCS